jgi:hypothetical protein
MRFDTCHISESRQLISCFVIGILMKCRVSERRHSQKDRFEKRLNI